MHEPGIRHATCQGAPARTRHSATSPYADPLRRTTGTGRVVAGAREEARPAAARRAPGEPGPARPPRLPDLDVRVVCRRRRRGAVLITRDRRTGTHLRLPRPTAQRPR